MEMQRDYLLKPRPLRWIIHSVAIRHGLAYRDLVGADKTRRVVYPRWEAFWECRCLTGASLPKIGRAFGKRDPTTVLHGIRKHQERMGQAVG